MKALKVLVMYLFVTLVINRISDSDNRDFLSNVLKNENKEELVTGSPFCTFELIEKSILLKRLLQDAPSKVHLITLHKK